MAQRRARLGDIHEVPMAFPEVTHGEAWGGRPAYAVRFTRGHFDGYDAVLLRERDISGVTRAELEEVICDAWLCRAPKRLAKEWLAQHRPG